MLKDPSFYVLIAFIIFFLAAGKKIFSQLASKLDAHIKKVAQELEVAGKEREEAQTRLNELKIKFHETKKHSEDLLVHAKTYQEEWYKQAYEELNSIIEKKTLLLRQRIIYLENQAIEEIRLKAAEEVVALLSKETHKEGKAISHKIGEVINVLPC